MTNKARRVYVVRHSDRTIFGVFTSESKALNEILIYEQTCATLGHAPRVLEVTNWVLQ